MVPMSACTTPQQMEAARTRLATSIAAMGTQAAVRMIMTERLGPGSEGLMLGQKAPEARPSLSEQLDAIVARVEARDQAEAA